MKATFDDVSERADAIRMDLLSGGPLWDSLLDWCRRVGFFFWPARAALVFHARLMRMDDSDLVAAIDRGWDWVFEQIIKGKPEEEAIA